MEQTCLYCAHYCFLQSISTPNNNWAIDSDDTSPKLPPKLQNITHQCHLKVIKISFTHGGYHALAGLCTVLLNCAQRAGRKCSTPICVGPCPGGLLQNFDFTFLFSFLPQKNFFVLFLSNFNNYKLQKSSRKKIEFF